MKRALFSAYLLLMIPVVAEVPGLKEIRAKVVGEKIDKLVTLDGRTYEGVTVVSVDDIGIAIRSAEGPSRIAFTRLDETLRKRFGYDPDAAKKQKEAENEVARQHDREMDQTTGPSGAPDKKTEPASPPASGDGATADEFGPDDEGAVSETPEPESLPDTKEVTVLNQYIAKLETGIRAARAERAEYQGKYNRAEARAAKMTKTMDAKGKVYYSARGGQKMALENYKRKMKEIDANIHTANRLIFDAKTKIAEILGTPLPDPNQSPSGAGGGL